MDQFKKGPSLAEFKPIIVYNQRLADEVHRQILLAITGGIIAPSDRIVQEKLAAEFQISRTPVREALLRLEQEGVLVTAGRGGFALRLISDEDAREIYSARQSIEGYSARLLAEAKDEAAFERIAEVIRTEEARQVTTAAEYYEANKAIHRTFVSQTGNRYLLEMFDLMWNRSISFHVFASTMSGSALAESLRAHLDLLDAVHSGDGDVAARAMREHIAQGLDLQLNAMRAAGRNGKTQRQA
ncbi:GntR family transcriptional regulator [Aminobacter carboxidus]|uniref:GntR family transcriptional regulator n=1 Tax=Aminobacter carboxidus TaxID=376165 RepID=A0ABR9GR29_9HYPH|nr:GntR family transcriptional regulator [Aminobacter carboxidus]MBE1206122.1 GntR family transcriptional regulator [Aminobacter carboxidus]